jgi:hypothetical protein
MTLSAERKCHVQGYDWEIDTTADVISGVWQVPNAEEIIIIILIIPYYPRG